MDPRDVNRINYNNYYVGQNLDFLVRSKMRSESLSTPLKNTPAFYDDEVSSKMSLLGKRGFYDPEYIYGFTNPNDNKVILQNEKNNFNQNKNTSSRNNEKIPFPEEYGNEYHNNDQILYNYENNNQNKNKNQQYLNKVNKNNNKTNNINETNIYRNNNNQYYNELLYKQRLEASKKVQTPQKLDNFQLDRIERNKENRNDEKEVASNIEKNKNEYLLKYEYDKNEEEKDRIYYEEIRRNNYGMVRNQDKIPNQDYYRQMREYNYINELSKKNAGDFVLPLTRNEILQGVLTENNNKNNFSK